MDKTHKNPQVFLIYLYKDTLLSKCEYKFVKFKFFCIQKLTKFDVTTLEFMTSALLFDLSKSQLA